MKVVHYDSPHAARDNTREYLSRDPLRNTIILTLLESRIADSLPGRYWAAFDHGSVVGIGVQTPLDRPIVLSVMSPDVAAMLAQAIGSGGEEVPGVTGEAHVASRFAGEWAACRKVGARPSAGRRLYEARAVREGAVAHGVLERATLMQEALAHEWFTAFLKEVGESPQIPEFIRRRVEAGLAWFWKDGDFKSVALISAPVSGGSRFQCVFTPPVHRRKGYAESLVRSVTDRLICEGVRPMLITDLADPGANGIYQRIGYEAAAEIILYRFDPSTARPE